MVVPLLPGSRVPGGAEGPGEEAEEGEEEGGPEAAAGSGHLRGPEPSSQALGGRAGLGLPVQGVGGTGVASRPLVDTWSRPGTFHLQLRWAQQHENWRFQKTRQTWLLLHMYDRDQVPDEHFSTLLAYLEGLRGQARELTVRKAEVLMRELDEARASADAPLPGRTQRVRQVLQLLS
ncbi:hypothetical protein EI555_002512 [Monodon monoceros]|uniref:WKF domain-containing protein n=1 Tax=Monodon monoceros TaxID=40151 RepID=A0A4V5PA54_MONMO|nr:hypothetical protein EI555_002512 [Monodon monoceros]